jgi:hypothetical protein
MSEAIPQFFPYAFLYWAAEVSPVDLLHPHLPPAVQPPPTPLPYVFSYPPMLAAIIFVSDRLLRLAYIDQNGLEGNTAVGRKW